MSTFPLNKGGSGVVKNVEILCQNGIFNDYELQTITENCKLLKGLYHLISIKKEGAMEI